MVNACNLDQRIIFKSGVIPEEECHSCYILRAKPGEWARANALSIIDRLLDQKAAMLELLSSDHGCQRFTNGWRIKKAGLNTCGNPGNRSLWSSLDEEGRLIWGCGGGGGAVMPLGNAPPIWPMWLCWRGCRCWGTKVKRGDIGFP